MEGKEITSQLEILGHIKEFYIDKYARKIGVSSLDCSNYLHDISNSVLSLEDATSCDGPISIQEITHVLKSMGSNKSPGNDGLTKEFYLAFFDVVGPCLCDSFNKSFDNGVLPTSQRQATITLIEKPGKDSRYIKSWRPISLLNVDVKILSKVLADRLTKVLPKLIHYDQTAFVSNRYIGEPIRLISDIMAHLDQVKGEGILFAADFAAAFDSIDYALLFEALKKYGFNSNFIKWIRLLHTDLQSCVMNNGHSTGYFNLSRGTRQGDPLAPYLFILIIEMLATVVRENKYIKGIIIGDMEVKQCLYADDTTYFLKDITSFQHLMKVLNQFSKLTSLKVNYDKSEAAWLGGSKASKHYPVECQWVDLTTDAISILGIKFTYDSSLSRHLNFDQTLDKFKTCLNMWRSRNLTIYGRAEILRTLAFPKILYVCNMLDPSKQFIDGVHQASINFIWKGKKPKVKYSTLIQDKLLGGISLPDLEARLKTQRLVWVKRLLCGDFKPWKQIAYFHLKSIGGFRHIRSNFNSQAIPKTLPQFYKSCLNDWAKFSACDPQTACQVLCQPLWSNACISSKLAKTVNPCLSSYGIHNVGDLFSDKAQLKQLNNFIPINS